MSTNDSSSNSEQEQTPQEEQTSDEQADLVVPKSASNPEERTVDLDAELAALRSLHQKEGEIPKKQRKKLLKKLKKILIARRGDVVEAISTDFTSRSSYETLAAEVMLVCNCIRHTLRHLEEWTEVQDKEVDLTFWPASIYQRPQALGVVGVISPWNYPVSLALTPIVQAISAGNRVLLKPSEHTPKTSALLEEILKEAMGSDYVRVCLGGIDVGIKFSSLAFDHLFFTGAPEVGKKIMMAASANLTPVTLELGGKSPALIHPSFSIAKAASRIATGKFLNAGQTCIAPDYVLCPKDKVGSFIEEIKKNLSKMYSSLKNNDDYTAIINARQRERLLSLVQGATESGAKIHIFNPKNEELVHKLAPHIIEGANPETRIMQEEIFGPILPVIPYDTIEEAILFINARHRPLAIYYFDNKGKRIKELIAKTHSGGVCINDTLLQVSQDEIQFGGIGNSGMGSYHGKAGFDTFSHNKPIFHQSRFSLVPLLTRPPYPRWVRSFVRFLIGW